MNRSHLLAVVILALSNVPCLAQGLGREAARQAPRRWNVEIKMADDRAFEGVMTLSNLQVQGDFGVFSIKPEKIKEVRFSEDQDEAHQLGQGVPLAKGTVITTSGEEFIGLVGLPAAGIVTELGTLQPNTKKVKSLTFKGAVPAQDPRERAGGQDPRERKGSNGLTRPESEQ